MSDQHTANEIEARRMIQLAMLAFVIWAFSTTPAPARCFSVWHYPRPQAGCTVRPWAHRIAYREVVPAPAPAPVPAPVEDDDRTWYVEITKVPFDDDGRAAGLEALKRAIPQ
jgi:hypothetical protein